MPAGKPGPDPGTPGPPHNPGLLKLVQSKRQGHYRPPIDSLRQGFRGWHERGYLPHFDAPRVTQFVTFMLHDAFPVKRRREWEPIWRDPNPSWRRRKIEAWLDRGHGACELRQPAVVKCVEDVLRSEDGQTYRLLAWVVMPNHVHLVVEVRETALSRLLLFWKGRSARAVNQLLGRRGHFWAREYFDTFIRDQTHLDKAIRYTENNPVKGRLVRSPRHWLWSSSRWRDEYERLHWQRDASTGPLEERQL